MKVCVLSLGCKVNKYESGSLLSDFKNKGYQISDKLEKADIYVINTCAVTNEAERKSRQMIARVKKFNPNAKIYVCGCASQNNPEQFLDKAELVKGVAGKNKIAQFDEIGKAIEKLPTEYENQSYSIQSRTRAYIKVQDGCNNFCTYCIIPYLRGRSRSREISSIVDEVKNLSPNIQEIVLTGINLSDYKIDGKHALGRLLQELDKFDLRIRLSSMEEVIADEDFIKLLSTLKNFCPHFHLSLQSGSNTVLKRMNRHYTAEEFEKTCSLIRKYFPLASISTDVIVGFPDESEKEFDETKQFIQKIEFSFLHIFAYSSRPGTVAAKMKDLPSSVKAQRSKVLQTLDKTLRLNFIQKNKFVKVLIEENVDGKAQGFSENYIMCHFDEPMEVGKIVDAQIVGLVGTEAKVKKL